MRASRVPDGPGEIQFSMPNPDGGPTGGTRRAASPNAEDMPPFALCLTGL